MRSAGSFGYLLRKEEVRAGDEAREVTKVKMSRLLEESRGATQGSPFKELIRLCSRYQGELFLFLSGVIFGVTLVYQKQSTISALAFSAMRQCFSFCITLILIPIIRWTNLIKSESEESVLLDSSMSRADRRLKLAFFGVMIAIGSTGGNIFQQIGLIGDGAGKAGFLGSFQVVFTPILDSYIHGIAASAYDWYAACISLFGVFILSGSGFGATLSWSDLSLILSALFWSLNITYGDKGARILDTLDLSLMDFGCSSLLGVLGCLLSSVALAGRNNDLDDLFVSPAAQAELPLVLGTAVTQALAVILAKLGFMTVASPRASLLIALNSVAAALAGYALLGEDMQSHEVLGSVVMLLASAASISGFGSVDVCARDDSGEGEENQGGHKYAAI